MNQQDPRVVIPGMMNQAQNGLQQLLERFEQELDRMYQYISHMDQKMLMMSIELGTARAHIQMLQGLIVEQEMYTKDEIEERYKTEVAEPIRQQIEELQRRQAEAQQKAQEAAMQAQQPPVEDTAEDEPVEEDEATESDVVLPSEKNNVVKFK